MTLEIEADLPAEAEAVLAEDQDLEGIKLDSIILNIKLLTNLNQICSPRRDRYRDRRSRR